MVVTAGADEAEIDPIAFAALGQQREHLHLAAAFRNLRKLTGAQCGRNFIEQRVDAFDTDRGLHIAHVIGRMRDERHPFTP